MLSISTPDMFALGLQVAGFTLANSQRTNMIRFLDTYGVHPETLVAILNDLQMSNNPDARVDNPDLVHFLLTFDWLKSYNTYPNLVSRWKLDEKTISNVVRFYTKKIQALKDEKIVWCDEAPMFILTVDGVHCRVRDIYQEVRNRTAKTYWKPVMDAKAKKKKNPVPDNIDYDEVLGRK